MKKDKIYELRIDEEDEISGIDSISLVSEPAIEINWVAFNKVKQEDFIIPDGEDLKYSEMITQKGQSEEELLNDGWVVHSTKLLGKDEFVSSTPNEPSFEDTNEYLIRYKYVLNPEAPGAAVKDTTRDFCRDLINKNFVYRVEDLDTLQNDLGSSALVWRGSFNCRHLWMQIKYHKDTKIINKGSVLRGRVDDEESYDVLGYPQPDTRTSNPSFSKEKFGYPLFETKEEAEAYAILLGCSGSHEHKYGDKILYMPCDEHPEDLGYDNNLPEYVDELPTGKTKQDFKTYFDYPQKASDNAKRALKWADENGWGSCGTPVGKQRANQLAKKEGISEETIARMASFARHRQNKDVPYDKGCGGLMWDAWGGTEGIEWAQRKLESIRKEQNMSKQKFQIDDEKRIVVGPAMVPDLEIFRKDKNGDPYYVVFKQDTIKMIAEKYMRNKYIDNNDTEHNGKAADDVYVIESWIKEDKEDKSNKYGFQDLPIGTWFVSMKIKNDDVWNMVKERKLNGFSVSGFFEEVEQFYKEQEFLKRLAEILKNV